MCVGEHTTSRLCSVYDEGDRTVGKLKPGGNYVDPEPFIARRGDGGGDVGRRRGVECVGFPMRRVMFDLARRHSINQNCRPYDASVDLIHHRIKFI